MFDHLWQQRDQKLIVIYINQKYRLIVALAFIN